MAKKPIEIIEAKEPDTNVKNSYRVPKKQWERWCLTARAIFNYTFEYMLANGQSLMSHPKQKKMPEDQWRTIAWNASWVAAEGCMNYVDSMAEE